MLAQNASAAALLMVTPLNEMNALADFDMSGVKIPVMMMDQTNAEILGRVLAENLASLSPTIIQLEDDVNNWQQKTAGAKFIVFQVFVLTAYGVVFILSIRGLILQIHHDGLSLNPSQTILAVSIVALILLIL